MQSRSWVGAAADVGSGRQTGDVHIVVGVAAGGVLLTSDTGKPELLLDGDFVARVAALENGPDAPRWVWDDTQAW